MSLYTGLATAVAEFEGFFKFGSRAARNNNPGNLKYAGQAGAIGADSAGFAIFPSPDAGWSALERQIALDAGRGYTLDAWVAKYAPPSENNTAAYLSYLVQRLGVSGSAALSDLAAGGQGQVAAALAAGAGWLYAALGLGALSLVLLLRED